MSQTLAWPTTTQSTGWVSPALITVSAGFATYAIPGTGGTSGGGTGGGGGTRK